ncbi:pyridoxal-phosphate dependent enzyme, partial [SAR202 cluster bacterium AC-409-J13_OGT_754m]|nr:pyridoxal-phosphate dependent enzyme [SAR202 cluster bacterium AC-409-J13_OGT_754m]
MKTSFICIKCNKTQPSSVQDILCHRCNHPMDLESPHASPPHPLISLGEGSTPIVQLESIGKRLDLTNLFAKLEYQNPTGSFKDRGAALLVSELKSKGVEHIAEDSSGNAGASIAAYCARAGIKASIFVPSEAPQAKVEQISFYGADIIKISGGRQAVANACQEYCMNNGIVYASHNLNPYFLEGTVSFGEEIIHQMHPQPSQILFPVGNGSLLIGTWKAYMRLHDSSYIKVPGLHAIQSINCMPIVSAFKGAHYNPSENASNTIAGGIAVQSPPRLQQCLSAIKETKGVALAVEEASIKRWQTALAQDEGVFVEPTSAAVMAGLEVLIAETLIDPDEPILVALTGS